MKFNEVLEVVRAWFEQTEKEYGRQIGIEVVQNNDEAFRAFFESQMNIAELIVVESDFAPFRFVSFQVISTIGTTKDNPVFCYYDSDTCTIRDILWQLDTGLKQMI